MGVIGNCSGETFYPLWEKVKKWECYFYVTDGWKVYANFINDGDQIISKTYMDQSRRRKYAYFVTILPNYIEKLLLLKSRLYVKAFNSLTDSLSKILDVPVPYRHSQRSLFSQIIPALHQRQ